MRGLIALLAIIVGAAACSNRIPVPLEFAKPDTDFELNAVPNFKDARFDLQLRSLSGVDLCIHSLQWPSPSGQVHFREGVVFAVIDEKYHDVRQRNLGSPGGRLRIEPSGRLEGFISFDEFPTAKFDDGSETRLVFEVRPFWCPKGEVDDQ